MANFIAHWDAFQREQYCSLANIALYIQSCLKLYTRVVKPAVVSRRFCECHFLNYGSCTSGWGLVSQQILGLSSKWLMFSIASNRFCPWCSKMFTMYPNVMNMILNSSNNCIAMY